MSQPLGVGQQPLARRLSPSAPGDQDIAAPVAPQPPVGPAGAPGWASVRPTNAKAIVAVSLLWVAPAAIVFGVLARREIRRTGEAGWGLATWALGLGIAAVAVYLLYAVAVVGLYVVLVAGAVATGSVTGFD